MTKSAFALLLILLCGARAEAQQRVQQPVTLEESLVDFYVGEFQRVVNPNPDLYLKVRPLIREFIRTRFEVSARRQETLQQLQMLVNRRESTDDDIRRAVRDLDKEDADIQANQDRFLTSIDPLLNTRQQGRVRVFQQVADQRMRQMLNSIKNGRSANQ